MSVKLKFFLFVILQAAIFILTVMGLTNGVFSALLVCALAVSELILLAFMYRLLIRPAVNLQKLLAQCREKNDSAIELLQQTSSRALFAEEISDVVALCCEYATRANSAIIHDKEAELAALQSQINPHFLYNTLDSIRGQAIIDHNYEIANMVKALAGFFRYSISRMGSLVTLRDELANVKNYMVIQQYRFNNRFSLQTHIDEDDESALDFLVPKLIIQPIIENSIYHGFKEKLEGGVISITVALTNKNLLIKISDNGGGMDDETLAALNRRIREQMTFPVSGDGEERQFGIALSNINKRIQLLFGHNYGLGVFSTRDYGTDVELNLPSDSERAKLLP